MDCTDTFQHFDGKPYGSPVYILNVFNTHLIFWQNSQISVSFWTISEQYLTVKGQRTVARLNAEGKFTTLFTTYPRLHTRRGRTGTGPTEKLLFFLALRPPTPPPPRGASVRHRHRHHALPPTNQTKLLFCQRVVNRNAHYRSVSFIRLYNTD